MECIFLVLIMLRVSEHRRIGRISLIPNPKNRPTAHVFAVCRNSDSHPNDASAAFRAMSTRSDSVRNVRQANNSKTMTDWINTKKAMQLLGVGSTTIKRWADQDKLPFIRTVGGHRRFRRDAVNRLLRQQPATDKNAAIREWIELLTDESDVMKISAEISQLRHELGDWYRAADFLDNVMREIWSRRSDDAESEAWSLIAAGRLGLALSAISSLFVAKPTAPIALLATFGGREFSHRSALIGFCARSEEMEVIRADAKTPARELTSQIIGRDQRVLILCATDQCNDCGPLVSANREISAACQEEFVDLVVGFAGDRPEFGDYGYNCNSFGDLKNVLHLLKLDLDTASNN